MTDSLGLVRICPLSLSMVVDVLSQALGARPLDAPNLTPSPWSMRRAGELATLGLTPSRTTRGDVDSIRVVNICEYAGDARTRTPQKSLTSGGNHSTQKEGSWK
jgi:hypothetical protein